jgi:hypothetical protein
VTSPRLQLPPGPLAWPLLAVALVLLNASLTFANVWPTPAIRWQHALSVELAAVVLLLVLTRGRPAWLRRALPIAWLLLVVGHYLDVTAPAIYGRDFNLYWDARHIGNVVAMIAEAAPAWQIIAVGIGALIALGAAYAISRVLWTWVADAAARTALRGALAVLAVPITAIFGWQQWTGELALNVSFAAPVSTEYGHQARSVLAMLGPGAVTPTLGASPAALALVPDDLGGADVYLVFVESYGAITFDEPDLVEALAEPRARFAQAVHDTGRDVLSAFVEAPTFGASSWLSHLTMMSGIKVADPYSYQSLMTQQRETLSTTFRRAGYRVVALMPGMRQAWPEGAFYQYDHIYGRDALAYTGPRFGWWSIPDQYSLAKLDELEGKHGTRAPLFAVFPTSTTHAPFGPVAPYQPDWSRVLGAAAYDPAEVDAILARPPDLLNLRGDYAHAMAYEFTTFAGYLRHRAGDDLLMIFIGDHQPPAAVSGHDAPWTVPVHIVTGHRHIVERLAREGFTRGLTPSRPVWGEMHELVPALLGVFNAGER